MARVLCCAAEAPSPGAAGRPRPAPTPAGERELRWALEGGIGALVHRAAAQGAVTLPAAWRDAVLGADLAARVRHGMLLDTVLEVLAVCERLSVPATLLKGISVAEQFYPEGHLRPMTDVDVLVPEAAFSSVQRAMRAQGYVELPLPVGEVFHHGPPLQQPRTGAVVEVHTALFAARSPFSYGTLFGARRVASQTVGSAFQGRAVGRLSAELQLAYIASSWFNDLTTCGIHPSFLPSLLDAAYLLKAQGAGLRWDELTGWLDNEFARAALYVLLGYVPAFGSIAAPREAMAELKAGSLVAPWELRLIHRALDRCLVGARPWDRPWPLPVPGRYNPAVQFNKKVLRRVPGAALRPLPRQAI